MEVGFKLDLNVAANASKGGRIVTGVYSVTIEKNYLYKSEKGNNLIDLELKSDNGEVGFINRLCIDPKWESGADNLDYPRWQELAAAIGMKSLTPYPSKRKTQDGEVDAQSIKELQGKKFKVAVYQEFDAYNNKERETLKLQNSFLESGQSVAEAMAKKPADRIKKLEQRLAPYYTKAWKEWKSSGGSQEVPTTTSTSTPAEDTTPSVPTEEENVLFG